MILKNKLAIVTGGNSGIGQGIVIELSSQGAQVIIADKVINDNTKEIIQCSKNKIDYIHTDVANPQSVNACFTEAINRHEKVDILVNCAGINMDAMLHKMTLEQWQKVIDVDLSGTFYCMQLALRHMRPRKYGRIINIASGSWLGNIGQGNYAAAKAGVVGLTKTAARENARLGITCNAICPGFIETPMTLKLKEINNGKAWQSMIDRIPMGYAGTPRDVAKLVSFLASDEACYITSEVINVGGGMIV